MLVRVLALFLITMTWAPRLYAVMASLSNPQGLLWHLHEAGYDQAAAEWEQHLEKVLTEAEIRQVTRLNSNTSPAYIVQFDNRIFAVMKESDPTVPDSARFDRATYLIDRMLDLNMVPLTVTRQVEGKTYSLQLYYPQYLTPQKMYVGTELHSLARLYNLNTFDLLVANVDRVVSDNAELLHNVVIGDDGRLIAIDHPRTFAANRAVINPEGKIRATKSFKSSLARLFEPANQERLLQYLSPTELNLLVRRAQALQERITEVSNDDPSRPSPYPLAEIKAEFKKPQELQNKVFVDMFAMDQILGPRASSYTQEHIESVFNQNKSYWRSLNRALVNWKYYPKVTRDLLLPEITTNKAFIEKNLDFLVEVIKTNPEYFDQMVRSPLLRRVALYSLSKASVMIEPRWVLPEHRALLISHLVYHYKLNRVGINFDRSFTGNQVSTRNAYLREFYSALKSENLEHQVFDFFRLGLQDQGSLLADLVAAHPSVAQQNHIKSELVDFIKPSVDNYLRVSRSNDSVNLIAELLNQFGQSIIQCKTLFAPAQK